MYTMKQILERVVSILLPERCVFCGGVAEFGDYCCGKCEIPCAEAVVLPKESALDGAAASVYYMENARKAVLRLKRVPDKRTARFFAELMYAKVKADLHSDFDILVPIPVNPKKLAERGFNQAEVLARELGALMGKEVTGSILSRSDFAGSQHKLTAIERMENARKSYSLIDANPVKGRRILLVDDVYTTGSTVEACALLLKNAGAASVCAITATKTKQRD